MISLLKNCCTHTKVYIVESSWKSETYVQFPQFTHTVGAYLKSHGSYWKNTWTSGIQAVDPMFLPCPPAVSCTPAWRFCNFLPLNTGLRWRVSESGCKENFPNTYINLFQMTFGPEKITTDIDRLVDTHPVSVLTWCCQLSKCRMVHNFFTCPLTGPSPSKHVRFMPLTCLFHVPLLFLASENHQDKAVYIYIYIWIINTYSIS